MSRRRIDLTPLEISVIERTVLAASEVLNQIMSKHSAKERAMVLCRPHRQSTKSITSTYSLCNIVDGKQELPARRERIRERLPGELTEIDKSDLSDILQGLVRLHFLKNPKKIARPRGRPRGLGFKDDNRGGKPSNFDKSTELEGSIQALKNPNIRRSINIKLMENGVLAKFLKYRNLISYYLIRMDENAYWRTLMPFPFVKEALADRPKAIQLFLNKIRSLSENDMEKEAEISAQKTLIRNSDNFTLFIDILAGALAMRGTS